MEISDFQFGFRQIARNTFETLLTSKDNVKFGCNYQSRQPAPPADIFEEFKKNHRNFFIDVESEIIPDKPIIEVAAPIENKVEEIPLDNPAA